MTNLNNYDKSTSREISPYDKFISYQESDSSNLLTTQKSGQANPTYSYNGEEISFHTLVNVSLSLLDDFIFYTGLPDTISNPNIYVYKSDHSIDLLIQKQNSIISSLKTSTQDNQKIIAWIDQQKDQQIISSCLFINDSCQENLIYQSNIGEDLRSIYLSGNNLLFLSLENSLLIFKYCSLNIDEYSNPSQDAQICSDIKSINTQSKLSEIKHLHLYQNHLVWNQLNNGTFEIFTSELGLAESRITKLSSDSSGDQLHPFVNVIDDSVLYTWENYSQAIPEIMISFVREDQVYVNSTGISGEFPQLKHSSGKTNTCSTFYDVLFWNEKTSSLETYNLSPGNTTFQTQQFDFTSTTAYTDLKLTGSINPKHIKVSWKSDAVDEWASIKIISNLGQNSVRIRQPVKYAQFQISLTDKSPQCLDSMELIQGGDFIKYESISTDQDIILDIISKYGGAPETTPEKKVLLNTELYDQIKLLQILDYDQLENVNAIKFDNVIPRSSQSKLESISGTAVDPEQEIWFYLVNDDQYSIKLGSTIVDKDNKFSLLVSDIPNEFSGELYLVASQVSDIRIAPLIKNKTTIIPIYIYRYENLISQPKKNYIDLEISEVNFFNNNQQLSTLKSDFLDVYIGDIDQDLNIKIKGKIYADTYDQIKLSSTLLPSSLYDTHQLSPNSGGDFEFEIINDSFQINELNQLIIQALAEDSQDLSEYSLNFRLQSVDEYPNLAAILWDSSAKNISVIFLGIVLLFSLILVFSKYSSWPLLARSLAILIVLSELGLFSYTITSQTVIRLFEHGLVMIPGQEQTIQKKSASDLPTLSLTKLNDNLDVIPSLSSSWSNISPNIWEFILRQDRDFENQPIITVQEIINSIKYIINEEAPEQQYLASIKQIIGINEERIQFITHYPDPLLPQKLTKINIEATNNPELTSTNTQLYIPLEEFTDHSRYKLNENYFGLPFLDQASFYYTEVIKNHKDILKASIERQVVDIFDEPDPSIWPALFQNNYKILPKINTGSLLLLVNHNSYISKNSDFIAALQKILQSPRILQTSYFQYGRLADQFAPPGVVGYHAKIEASEEVRTATEILEEVKNELGLGVLTQKLHFPSHEHKLAQAIEVELEKEGVNVIPVEIPSEDFEMALLEDLPDLILVSLNFDLGDIGPFLDALIDSNSPFNSYYSNPQVDFLIEQSRSELNNFKRLELLHKIAQIIVFDDPAAIPLLFKKSFVAVKKPTPLSWTDKFMQKVVFGW